MAIRTIRIQGGERFEGLQKASAALYPGMLCELTSDSDDTVQKHSTAGASGERAIVFEDDIQGKEVSEVYADANTVQYDIYKRGERANVRIADGEAIAKGDNLVSNGDGYFKEATDDSAGTTEDIMCVALAACDMSDSSTVDPVNLCPVRFL